MDPVDAQIREANEQWELKKVVEAKWGIWRRIVEFSIPTNLKQEEGRGEDGHYRHWDHGLANLEPDLVFEILGVSKSGVVENEDVGESRKDKVEYKTKEPSEMSGSG